MKGHGNVRGRIAAALGMLLLGGVTSGCGGATSASMYMLFDASPSSSDVIRQGYREGAVLMGSSFCNRYRQHGSIVINVITAQPEQDSLFTTISCPHGKNETDQQAQMISFQRTFEAAVDEVIAVQAASVGTDVIGAILYGSKETFERLRPQRKYLIVFSDMQQSGGGLRNCILRMGAKASRCLTVYYKENPQYERRAALQQAEVYVAGVGRNIRGTVNKKEWRAYQSFWRSFFSTEAADVCWYSATNVPIQRLSNGTRVLDPNYFGDDDCMSAL